MYSLRVDVSPWGLLRKSFLTSLAPGLLIRENSPSEGAGIGRVGAHGNAYGGIP